MSLLLLIRRKHPSQFTKSSATYAPARRRSSAETMGESALSSLHSISRYSNPAGCLSKHPLHFAKSRDLLADSTCLIELNSAAPAFGRRKAINESKNSHSHSGTRCLLMALARMRISQVSQLRYSVPWYSSRFFNVRHIQRSTITEDCLCSVWLIHCVPWARRQTLSTCAELGRALPTRVGRVCRILGLRSTDSVDPCPQRSTELNTGRQGLPSWADNGAERSDRG
ncbi:hypothetical protein FB451DRAFT_68831 [Mycena latifolia]|nr:hypothetical protein FB451DRAFT_68831 [Mycena latifolia]